MKSANLLAFGAPTFLQTDHGAKDLLLKIIGDGNYLHNCLDYDGAMQFIANAASKNELKVKLISKIYLNYPVLTSPRRTSLLKQIADIVNLFSSTPLELVPQISSIWSLPKRGHEMFILKMYQDFHIKKLLFEVFPESQASVFSFIDRLVKAKVNLGINKEFVFGITTYDNPQIEGFTPQIIQRANEMALEIAPMRVLGSPQCEQDVRTAIRQLKSFYLHHQLFRGITKVSTLEHYNELSSIINEEFGEAIPRRYLYFNSQKYRLDARKIASNPYGLNAITNENWLKNLIKFCISTYKLLIACIRQASIAPLKKLTTQDY